jgi:hypothetical protein
VKSLKTARTGGGSTKSSEKFNSFNVTRTGAVFSVASFSDLVLFVVFVLFVSMTSLLGVVGVGVIVEDAFGGDGTKGVDDVVDDVVVAGVVVVVVDVVEGEGSSTTVGFTTGVRRELRAEVDPLESGVEAEIGVEEEEVEVEEGVTREGVDDGVRVVGFCAIFIGVVFTFRLVRDAFVVPRDVFVVFTVELGSNTALWDFLSFA